MELANKDIREAIRMSGLKNWEVADILGVHETVLSRKLRRELPLVEKKKILSVISEATGNSMEEQKELLALRKFKEYFDSLYGIGLEVSGWHYNGAQEPFDNFYESAILLYDQIID